VPIIPAEIWVQYSIVGIFIVAGGLAAAAFFRLWQSLLTWMETQDGKREAERKTQRDWQEALSLRRDAEMRAFLETMLQKQQRDEAHYFAILEKLTSKIDELIVLVQEHDTWERGTKYAGSRRKE